MQAVTFGWTRCGQPKPGMTRKSMSDSAEAVADGLQISRDRVAADRITEGLRIMFVSKFQGAVKSAEFPPRIGIVCAKTDAWTDCFILKTARFGGT